MPSKHETDDYGSKIPVILFGARCDEKPTTWTICASKERRKGA